MTSHASPRRVPTPLTVAILALAVAALLGAAAPSAALNPDGYLEGYVTDASSGLAIANATVKAVHVQYGWITEVATDAVGHYRTALRPGQYDLTIYGPGHDTRTDQALIGTGLTTWANETLNVVTQSVLLRGYVKDISTGDPVTTGRIVAEDWWGYGDVNASALNASGYYEMRLAVSYYYVYTDGVQGYDSDYDYLYIYSSGTYWLNFSLYANPLDNHVHGIVYDSVTYAPIANATVQADVEGVRFTNRTNATGGYDLWVPSGWVDYLVDAVGYTPGTDWDYLWGGADVIQNFYLTRMSASLRGYVRDRDTGLPVAGASVNLTTSSDYYDRVITDASGYYQIAVPTGSVYLEAGALGYATIWSSDYLSTGETAWHNLTIPQINSHVQGYVVAADTGAHLAGVNVYVYDSTSSFYGYVSTDGSGFYSLDSVSTTWLSVRAYGSSGYSGGVSYGITRPGQVSWINVTVYPATATVRVTVLDALNGSAISGAWVSLSWNFYYDWATTDATGTADVSSPVGPTAYLSVGATNYLWDYPSLTVVPGLNLLEVRLYPDLPTDVTLQGYVYDAGGSPISSADIEVSGYGDSTFYDYSDWTGFYSVSIVAAPQLVRITDWGLVANATRIDPAPGSVIWLNVTLYSDSTAPWILSFTANPATGVGPSRPTTLLAQLQDQSIDYGYLNLYRLYRTAGDVGTFQYLYASLYPEVTLAGPNLFNATAVWDTQALGGFLDDGTNRAWWPASSGGPPNTRSLSGRWQNATLGPTTVTLLFDATTGWPVSLQVPSVGYLDPATQGASTFQPYAGGVTANLTSGAYIGAATLYGPTFQLSSLRLSVRDSVPTGLGGAYLTVYDSSGRSNRSWVTFGIDVTAPVADAGGPYGGSPGSLFTLDGTRSSDDGVIVNYTWTFTDGGAKTLYGATPSYVFMSAGVYVVTLTVRDGGGNTASDTATVTVGTDTTAPVADAGADQALNEDVAVTFDGRASTDDFGITTYTWAFTDGSARTLTGATATYTFATPGVYTVTLTVQDAAGHSASDTMTVTVLDVTNPTVAILAPTAGASVSGLTQITLNVADNAGVARVELRIDGTLVSTDSDSPFGFLLNTATLAPGNHTIEVIAYDAAGNHASASERILVVESPGLGALVYGGIAAIAIVAALLVALLLLRRRRRPQPVPPAFPPAQAPTMAQPAPPATPEQPSPPQASPPAEGFLEGVDQL